jgi:hypothetical protein
MLGLVSPVYLLLLSTLTYLPLPTVPLPWSEGGHHLIAELAFELLSEVEQTKLLAILAEHPRYAVDFRPPENLATQEETHRWLAGRAGYWPDVARRQPQFNRPTWHYELGEALVRGDREAMEIPNRPGNLPEDATLDTQELYLSQAFELCRRTLGDKQRPGSDRALAICWLAHLVADAHQPCHAGSLYSLPYFVKKDGDRGANSIFTQQKRNLHALWDQALGERFSRAALRRRMTESKASSELTELGKQAVTMEQGMVVQTWLTESRQLAIEHVYTQEVLDWVDRQTEPEKAREQPLILSEAYLRNLGKVSQERAVQSAYRLAEVWKRALAE